MLQLVRGGGVLQQLGWGGGVQQLVWGGGVHVWGEGMQRPGTA